MNTLRHAALVLAGLLLPLLAGAVRAGGDLVRIREQNVALDRSEFLGVGLKFSRVDTSDRPEWLRLVTNMQVRFLRYPDGTIANYFDWRSGRVMKGTGRFPGAASQPAYPLEAFARLVQACGATPIFCLNMVTDTLESQRAMLHRASELGLPVRLVEMGNELNGEEPLYRERYPDAASYGKAVAEWMATLQADFPEARFGVVASGPHPWRDRPWQDWNREVLAQATGAHALVVHPYARTEWVLPGVPEKGEEPSEKTLRQQLALMEQAETQRAFLALPALRMGGLSALTGAFPGREIWCTEFNLADNLTPAGGSWLHGLVVAGFILEMLDQPPVRLALYHQLSGSRSYSAVYHRAWPRPWLGDTTTPFTLNPPGAVLTLVGQQLRDRPMVRRLDFSPNPVWPGLRRQVRADYPALAGFRLDRRGDAASPRWLVLNLSPESVAVAWPEDVAPVCLHSLSGPPAGQEFVEGGAAEQPAPSLPPFSLSVWGQP